MWAAHGKRQCSAQTLCVGWGRHLVCATATAGLVGVVGAEIDAMLGILTSKGDGSSSNFLYGSCRQRMYLQYLGFTVIGVSAVRAYGGRAHVN